MPSSKGPTDNRRAASKALAAVTVAAVSEETLRAALERLDTEWADYADHYDQAGTVTPPERSFLIPEPVKLFIAIARAAFAAPAAAGLDVDDFMAWLFRDGGVEPPRRDYDDVRAYLNARLAQEPKEK